MHERPNILLITCDQWRGDSLSAVGHPVVRTPHADALARDGVLFRRHYAGAAPCAPARACLYTGLYQMNNRVCRNGTPLDSRHDTIARAARRAGYEPTLFGYTDVAPDPRDHDPADPLLTSYEGILPGFTVRQFLPEHQKPWLTWLKARGHDVSMGSPAIHRPVGAANAISDAPPAYGRDETETAFLTDAFIGWLGEQEPARPWFAHVSFIRPHPPFVVPAPYNRMYAGADMPFARAGSAEAEAAIHPYHAAALALTGMDHFMVGAEGPVAGIGDAAFRVIRQLYWGMISEVDDQLGRIWSALKAAGAWDDTLVVLTSDHAEMMGDHLALGKGGFFDGSFHIPLVIRDPARADAHGTAVDAFTEAVDVMPTLVERMGLPALPHLDGRSLCAFLDGGTLGSWRDAAHWEADFRSVDTGAAEGHFGVSSRELNLAVVRTGGFKYVHFGGGLPPVLFDLVEDPAETRNLAGDAVYRDARLEMAERLLAWRARHLDQSLALSVVTADGVRGSYSRRHP